MASRVAAKEVTSSSLKVDTAMTPRSGTVGAAGGGSASGPTARLKAALCIR